MYADRLLITRALLYQYTSCSPGLQKNNGNGTPILMEDAEKIKRDDDDEKRNEQTAAKRDDVGQKYDDAGPSRITPLPGAIQHPKQAQLGISKSEHIIRHIITNKDVTNALQSIHFGAPTQSLKDPNATELKIPILDKDVPPNKDDSTTLIDLKKFMASCFKFNKDAPGPIVLEEVNRNNVQSVQAVISAINEPHELPNASEIQTESQPINPNEVIVTNIDPKLSKAGTEKKKTSGNISERSDLGVAQRDSLSSIGSNVCRICMTRGRERLISPCNCKGSLANVHLSCLERWLNQVGRNHCELCGFSCYNLSGRGLQNINRLANLQYSYPAIRTPRYTVLQALRLWFGNPRNRSHLQSDCLIFWLLSTVTAGLLAVCIVGTQYFVIEGTNFGKLDTAARKEEGISHRITETAMDFFMAIVLCGYSVTVYLLWKDHYVMWNRWRKANVNVRLLLSPDAHPVPFVPRNRYNVV